MFLLCARAMQANYTLDQTEVTEPHERWSRRKEGREEEKKE